MSISWTQLRHEIARQTGLPYFVTTYESLTPDQLQNIKKGPFGRDYLNGFHVYLPDVVAASDELIVVAYDDVCLLYTSPSPRDRTRSRMPSSA